MVPPKTLKEEREERAMEEADAGRLMSRVKSERT